MEKEYKHGKMAKNMKENGETVYKMVREYIHGLVVKDMMVSG